MQFSTAGYLLLILLMPFPLMAQTSLAERIRDAQLQDAALRAVEESIQVLRKQVSSSTQIAAELSQNPQQHQIRSQTNQDEPSYQSIDGKLMVAIMHRRLVLCWGQGIFDGRS